MLRRIFLALSRSKGLERWVVNSSLTRSAVQRFVAGSTVDDALAAARRLIDSGLLVTLDLLGEAVQDDDSADKALAEYLKLLERMAAQGILGSVSVKPTQLGLALDPERCSQRLRDLVERADAYAIRVEVDMEDSGLTQATLDMYFGIIADYPQTRVALQAYLHRTADDFRSVVGRGGRVRLVKGAYQEPGAVAMLSKDDVDASFLSCANIGLTHDSIGTGFHLALGTHDDAIIAQSLAWAQERNISPAHFEFQFLYGIRSDLQKTLNESGWAVRIYVPFGESWYPYFMRRLAERPANLAFVIRQYFRG